MAHGTTEPTEKYRDATATPISPVCGSIATMENVDTGGSGCATPACPDTKTPATKTKIDSNRNFFINFLRTPLYKMTTRRCWFHRALCGLRGENSRLQSQNIRQHHNRQHAKRDKRILEIPLMQKLKTGHNDPQRRCGQQDEQAGHGDFASPRCEVLQDQSGQDQRKSSVCAQLQSVREHTVDGKILAVHWKPPVNNL